jgi:hypothetical protein
MSACIKGGIVAGIILFIWSALSWMVLPWHKATLNTFKNEKAVVEVMKTNATQSGIYFLPMQSMEGVEQEATAQPLVFSSVKLEGMPGSMAKPMAFGLIGDIIAAMLVGWILLQTRGLGYIRRVGVVVTFALAASIVAHLPNWNWFAFDTNYTLVLVADTLIGWFLAGLVLAGICKK